MKSDTFCVTKVDFAYCKRVTDHYKLQMENRPAYGLIMVFGGKMTALYKGKRYSLEKGDIFIPRKNDSYVITANEISEYIVISYQATPTETLEELLPKECKFTPSHLMRYLDAFKGASDIFFAGGICSEGLLQALVQEILCNIIRENYPKALLGANNPAAAAKYFIEEFSSKPITTLDIAKAAGCSQSYLRALFGRAYGVSPIEYLNVVRIERAKEMLKTDLYKISEVAENCGFSNVHYFSRVFKERTGVSPKKY
ncbi:MAG: helix-turn-helix domain-containing protein [Ruminococcaceae bacterium]|nr:helix-turn-helix domain-containing protein [Oscillospiraceae bacterium]